jgi:hypothetical protein
MVGHRGRQAPAGPAIAGGVARADECPRSVRIRILTVFRARLEGTVKVELELKTRRMLRVSFQVLFELGCFPELFTEQELAIDQLEGSLAVGLHGGMIPQVRPDGHALADSPPLALIDPQDLGQLSRGEFALAVEEAAQVGPFALTPEAPEASGR